MASEEVVPQWVILRFDVVPPDQRQLAEGEFLVFLQFFRVTKATPGEVSLGKSCLFKVVPGEPLALTKERFVALGYFARGLLTHVVVRAKCRILNDDEVLDAIVAPDEVISIVLPDKLRAMNALKVSGSLAQGAYPGVG
jgi:hypothetical protein